MSYHITNVTLCHIQEDKELWSKKSSMSVSLSLVIFWTPHFS